MRRAGRRRSDLPRSRTRGGKTGSDGRDDGDGGDDGGGSGGILGTPGTGCPGPGCGGDGVGCVGGLVHPGVQADRRGGVGYLPRMGGGAVGHDHDGCGGGVGPCSPRMHPAAAAVGHVGAGGVRSGPPLRLPGSS